MREEAARLRLDASALSKPRGQVALGQAQVSSFAGRCVIR